MKFRSIIIVSLLLSVLSCAPGANTPLKDHLLAYNWKITYAKSNNTDITSSFSPYVFNFEPNDVIIATRADSSFTGTWYRSNSSEDNPKIVLSFGSHYQLSKLNYDWQQDERTDNVIKFVDEMSANSTEAVTFEKF